ncbi:MAG: helix-turn-helix transcriptional regulator [Burkholderiales bacterium]
MGAPKTTDTTPGRDAPRADLPDTAPALSAFASVVDRSHRGLLIFDADARVLAHNVAARDLLHDRSSLRLVPLPGVPGGAMRLTGPDGAAQAAIEDAVHDCASAALGLPTSDPSARRRSLHLRPPGSRLGLALHLTPLGPLAAAPRAQAAAVAGTLIDLSRQPTLEGPQLTALFGLSASSARVAEAYLRADSVKDVARRLGISTNTVKTHLATIYERTGCTRQSQLVRLLMALAEGDVR